MTVQEIHVLGAPNEKSAIEIVKQSQIAKGQKLARIEPRVAQRILEEIDWIESVRVNRSWLHRNVEIGITARRPIAALGGANVDLAGKIFTLEEKPRVALPVLKVPTLSAQKFVISLLVSLPTDIRTELRELRALNQNSATLILHNSRTGRPRTFTVIWGDESSKEFKVKVYKALLALPENKKISLLDLSAPHAPIVK